MTFFVEDLEAQTKFYAETLNLPPADIRVGWSEFGCGNVTIAFHRGKGRKPRLEFVCNNTLEQSQDYFRGRGARLGEIREFLGKRIIVGKDKDGNSIQISEQS